MRLARRRFVTLAGAAIAAPALARFAHGQAQTPAPIVLKLHHFFSPLSNIHVKFLVPWAKKIGAESENRLRIDVFGSMQLGGVPAALYDQARDGVADIVWALPGLSPGRFAGVQVFELPFVGGRRALVNARAAQEFADLHLKDEFREVRPLCVCAHDHGLIHTAKPVATMEDLKDLKLRPPTRLAGEALTALGASAAFVPLPQVREAFGRKVLEGFLLPWDTAAAAKVHELTKYHAEISVSPSLSISPYILAMNPAKYAALPPELRKVIDDNSGEAAATMVGQMWDREAAAVEDMVRKRGNTITAIAADEAARWRKATDDVSKVWLAQAPAYGPKLIEAARALVQKHEAAAAGAAPPAAPAAATAPTAAIPAAAAPASPACQSWCPSP